MKAKHWQGYGIVDMKKISQNTKDGIKTIIVQVSGNHEWGLERNDIYDVHKWICSRLAKDCKEYCDIVDLKLNSYYKKINNLDVEFCDYTISYRI